MWGGGPEGEAGRGRGKGAGDQETEGVWGVGGQKVRQVMGREHVCMTDVYDRYVYDIYAYDTHSSPCVFGVACYCCCCWPGGGPGAPAEGHGPSWFQPVQVRGGERAAQTHRGQHEG